MRRVPENRSFPELAFYITMRLNKAISPADQPRFAQLIVETLQFYRKRGDILLGTYVVMPDHIHLIIRLMDVKSLSWWINRFKSYVATQFGKGLIWQTGCWTEELSSAYFFQQKRSYIHFNPVRAGFVEIPEAYPWSSAKEFFLDEVSNLIDY